MESRLVNSCALNVLQDIAGHVVEFSGDQHGSRFIQHKLTTANEENRNMVYREIIPTHVISSAQNVFGNYVGHASSLFRPPVSPLTGPTTTVRTRHAGRKSFNRANAAGSHSHAFIGHLRMQSAPKGKHCAVFCSDNSQERLQMIDYLGAAEQARWVAELHGHILQCVKDANGNHVSPCDISIPTRLTRRSR